MGAELKPAGRKADLVKRDRRELVAACHTAVARARAVMKAETDHVMQHQLHSLIGELLWCAREYGMETEGRIAKTIRPEDRENERKQQKMEEIRGNC